MEVQSESDVAGILSSASARQPDTKHFRLWEVAGTAHADAYIVGDYADGFGCGAPINSGPMYLVAHAALRSLVGWVADGDAPPEARRLQLTDDKSEVVRDDDGIALGGVRTPPVDVPIDVLSGALGPSSSTICILLGTTTPLSDARLAKLHASATDYEAKYEAATNKTIRAGFMLRDDRKAILGFSDPSRLE